MAVLDSWVTAGALEFLVRRARALANGGCSLDEVVEDLTKIRMDTRIVFSVPDMAALSRSGRLGAIRRAVATKLNRYPVMALSEGGIVQLADGRGARGMAAAMAEQVPDGTTDLIVSHFGPRGPEAREAFLAARSRFPEAHIRVKDGGPVLAEHLGLGAVASPGRRAPVATPGPWGPARGGPARTSRYRPRACPHFSVRGIRCGLARIPSGHLNVSLGWQPALSEHNAPRRPHSLSAAEKCGRALGRGRECAGGLPQEAERCALALGSGREVRAAPTRWREEPSRRRTPVGTTLA